MSAIAGMQRNIDERIDRLETRERTQSSEIIRLERLISETANSRDTDLRIRAIELSVHSTLNDDRSNGFTEPSKVIENATAIYKFMKGN